MTNQRTPLRAVLNEDSGDIEFRERAGGERLARTLEPAVEPSVAAFVADPEAASGDEDVEARAAFVALRDALVTAGLMEPEPEPEEE